MSGVPVSIGPVRRMGESVLQVFSDSLVLCGREIGHWRRQPAGVLIGWLFPVMTVLMFGYLFGGAIEGNQEGGYFEFFMPGMFAMTMLFGLEATLTAVSGDAAKGITDRFRSMPMSGSAVVLGRSLADMLNTVIGLAVVVICGFLVGWQWHLGPARAFAAFALLLLLRFSLLWVGIYLGLGAKSPGAVMAVQILVWPLSFLANIFVDPATMPDWLGTLAEWNPVSATVTASRLLFGNPGWETGSWVSRHAVLMALAWPALITLVFFPLSVRRYRNLSR